MASNPFYVDPGNDYTAGLSGLSATLSNVRQDRMVQADRQRQLQAEEDRKQRLQDAQAAANQAFSSGDPQQMLQASLQYPEIADNLQKTMGLDSDLKKKEGGDFAQRLLTAPPEQREQIYQQRIKSLQDQGRDPTHTIESYHNYQSNPNGELQALETVWAGAYPEQYKVVADQHAAARKQANEDRKFGLSERKLAQDLTIAQMGAQDRNFTKQLALLTAQQGQAMNDLKREELNLKISGVKEKADQNKVDMQNKASSEKAAFDDTLSLVNSIENAPGLEGNFGKRSYIPNVRGSEASDAKALIDQLGGKAFLEAYNGLRGGGSITEVEGKEAKNALINMQNAQSVESFRKNLSTFKSIIERGQKVAAQKQAKYLPDGVQQGQTSSPRQPEAQPNSGWRIVE